LFLLFLPCSSVFFVLPNTLNLTLATSMQHSASGCPGIYQKKLGSNLPRY
jgi:hypothetical protein